MLKGTTPASRRKFFIRNETVERLYTPEDLRLQAYFADFFRMKEEPVSVTQGAAYVRMWREVEYYSGGIYDGTPRTLLANDILIRLPDILLLRAEMKAATGDREGAVADLDVVRRRAGVAVIRRRRVISGGRYSWNATGSCCFRRGCGISIICAITPITC